MTPFREWLLYPLIALAAGFALDFIIGDAKGFFDPAVPMKKLFGALADMLKKLFPSSVLGRRIGGVVLLFFSAALCFALPFVLIHLCRRLNIWLAVAAHAFMCWQIISARAMRGACIRVLRALKRDNLSIAQRALSRIVCRDTDGLDEGGVIRAAVESAGENTCYSGVAPLLLLALGGAPLGMLYKAVNTLGTMFICADASNKNIALIPAIVNAVLNFIPARLAALFMLLSGFIRDLNVSNAWRIFRRDRYNHADPNSGQTMSVCAGLLGARLGGTASYGGVARMGKSIGDPLRKLERRDIVRSAGLLYDSALLTLVLFGGLRLMLFFALSPR